MSTATASHINRGPVKTEPRSRWRFSLTRSEVTPGGAYAEDVEIVSCSSNDAEPMPGCTGPSQPMPSLVTTPQLPAWFHAEPYIETGYRVHYSFSECIWSLFSFHNEVFNIWTHLAATILWAHLAWVATNESEYLHANDTTKTVVLVSYVVVGCIPIFSALAHWFHPIGPLWYYWLWRLDYAGIWGGWIARIGFELWFLLGNCNPRLWLFVFGTMATLFLLAAPSLLIRRQRGTFVPLFALVHAPLFLWLASPVARNHPDAWTGMQLSIAASILGALGVVIDILCIPERWFPPGSMDSLIHSHVIWHVVGGAAPFFCLFAGKYYLAYMLNPPEDHCSVFQDVI